MPSLQPHSKAGAGWSAALRGFWSSYGDLKGAIGLLRATVIWMAVKCALLAKSIRATADYAKQQKALSQAVAEHQCHVSALIDGVLHQSGLIARLSSEHLQTSKATSLRLTTASGAMRELRDEIDSAATEIHNLQHQTEKIEEVMRLISSVARQTSLLSVNASIEAARAGDVGRGFAVVAGEVKKLAEQVNQSVQSIDGTVSQVLAAMASANKKMSNMLQGVHEADRDITQEASNVAQQVVHVESIQLAAIAISQSVQEVAQAALESGALVNRIGLLSQKIDADSEAAALEVALLSDRAESLQSMAVSVAIGDKLDAVIRRATRYHQQVVEKLEQLLARGVDIFDLQYQDVPHTDPPKFRTSYDIEFARVMTPFYDHIVADIGILFYCNALDVNGYVPAHNGIYSQPVTGDYEHDLKHSRDKRKMVDAASQKAVKNHTDRYLLVTYLRDNGDVVSDLSFPLYVGGKHWGAMRFGMDANRL
ncbi:hypothetical protein EXV95_18960 [Acidovorax sp. JMULE5]|uniref:methyl-accepting chemotaxis protein n=1 Tax=Acidovorax sp. JMULE5 TaxID=2518343 RepID=UPI0015A3B3AD|nr:methyl-accepting chemotaxis protein [Acidovorax sp. JMULE5]QLA82533.1 hypothetical protein EXV95_18960 [Acidovorax sp. JMULE5]